MAQQDSPVIVWFREDLRLADNPALNAAAATGRPVLGVFILDEESDGIRRLGGASRWWLHHSLAALRDDLAALGSALILLRGSSGDVLRRLAGDCGATAVHWNRRYAPAGIALDTNIKADLTAAGLEAVSHPGNLLAEPWTVATADGAPYRVFTPFWKAARAQSWRDTPLPAPDTLQPFGRAPTSDRLEDWGLLPRSPDWAAEFPEHWTPGETGARQRLTAFLETGLSGYASKRDRPDLIHTSRLSPHLRFGEISPVTIAAAVAHARDSGKATQRDADKFLAEIGWREFSYHLLYHVPTLPTQNLQPRFDAFPWVENPQALAAWQRGMTGYPLVDAGMRELWRTGTMHNRVRMVVASFLIKNLLIHWREGEAWFWDTLLDADHANNAASWQWVAGCGADAAPFFRIFNPVLQGEKHDPDGAYVRRFVPELANLPAKFIHRPWEAPSQVLADAGVTLGATYPQRIVDHAEARNRALAAFETIKGQSRTAA